MHSFINSSDLCCSCMHQILKFCFSISASTFIVCFSCTYNCLDSLPFGQCKLSCFLYDDRLFRCASGMFDVIGTFQKHV